MCQPTIYYKLCLIAEATHQDIRNILTNLYGSETAENVTVQYGGSVSDANVDNLMAQKNIDILNLETDNLPYKSNYFDLIILSEVVEHLGTGINHLYSEVTRCLKPGAFFIVTTPNVIRLHNLFSLIIGKNIYFPLFQLEQPHNFRHQREYALSELISFAPKNLAVSQSQYLIAYPPFRQKVSQEPFFTRLSKWLLYFLLLIFPSRRDTLVVVFRKK